MFAKQKMAANASFGDERGVDKLACLLPADLTAQLVVSEMNHKGRSGSKLRHPSAVGLKRRQQM